MLCFFRSSCIERNHVVLRKEKNSNINKCQKRIILESSQKLTNGPFPHTDMPCLYIVV